MTDWTSGYIADIGYTFGYYRELNPLAARFAITNAGFHPPQNATACELGFGQGISVNIHAAASGTSWFGTDFNPSQAGFAQDLATVTGADAQLYDQAFADFAQRADLPDFDFIGLHGIWSWISPENQAVIVDFVRRKLKVGGVLYISYNTQPGWAAMVPLRHLLTEHAEVMAASGRGIVSRIDAAIEFTEAMLATQPIFSRANPHLVQRFDKIKGQNRQYLAHEYFNRDWSPIHFSEMAERLTQAKMSYVCSAHIMDHVDHINLTAEQRSFMAGISDPVFRQTVRDFMVNQQFRRDYWVKGPRVLSPLDKVEALRSHRVLLVVPKETLTLKAVGNLGEITLNEAIYSPILDALADHQPKTIGQLEAAVAKQNILRPQLIEALMILIGKGSVAVAQDEKAVGKARAQCEKFNRFMAGQSRSSGEFGTFASPVTGGGIEVPRFEQLFLVARAQGQKQPEEWAAAVWQILKSQGQKIIGPNGVLESDEENIGHLVKEAKNFAEKRLPLLRALGVA